MLSEKHIPIHSSADVAVARQDGRVWALREGFTGSDLTVIASVISEVARNIVDHAHAGEIVLTPAHRGKRDGISIVAHDEGPGIPDIHQALQPGFSTRETLGVGLPGVRSLVDEFDIQTTVGRGTTVVMKKWLRRA